MATHTFHLLQICRNYHLNDKTLRNLGVFDGSFIVEDLATAYHPNPALSKIVVLSKSFLDVCDAFQRVDREFLVLHLVTN